MPGNGKRNSTPGPVIAGLPKGPPTAKKKERKLFGVYVLEAPREEGKGVGGGLQKKPTKKRTMTGNWSG